MNFLEIVSSTKRFLNKKFKGQERVLRHDIVNPLQNDHLLFLSVSWRAQLTAPQENILSHQTGFSFSFVLFQTDFADHWSQTACVAKRDDPFKQREDFVP